jgi:serine/threonine protein kinase
VWRDQPYDAKSDIWSLGCVLYESICLHPPFRADEMSGLYKKVLKGVYPKIPEQYSMDLTSILHMLLQVSPMNRPSCSGILQSQIVKRRIELLFPDKSCIDDSPNKLLQTIRIPRDLLYLTDKLPKPCYDDSNKRNTSDLSDYQLPKIKKRKGRSLVDRKRSPIKEKMKIINVSEAVGLSSTEANTSHNVVPKVIPSHPLNKLRIPTHKKAINILKAKKEESSRGQDNTNREESMAPQIKYNPMRK